MYVARCFVKRGRRGRRWVGERMTDRAVDRDDDEGEHCLRASSLSPVHIILEIFQSAFSDKAGEI